MNEQAAVIRVLVADDHALVREGIRHVLDAEPGIEVVAEAANGREAVELAVRHNPDVVVLDITMPEETGLKAAARLRDLLPSARVLLLSMHDHVEYVREGMRIGTHGYILKDSAGEELRAAIRAVHAGGTFFSPAVVKRLSAGDVPAPPQANALLEAIKKIKGYTGSTCLTPILILFKKLAARRKTSGGKKRITFFILDKGDKKTTGIPAAKRKRTGNGILAEMALAKYLQSQVTSEPGMQARCSCLV